MPASTVCVTPVTLHLVDDAFNQISARQRPTELQQLRLARAVLRTKHFQMDRLSELARVVVTHGHRIQRTAIALGWTSATELRFNLALCVRAVEETQRPRLTVYIRSCAIARDLELVIPIVQVLQVNPEIFRLPKLQLAEVRALREGLHRPRRQLSLRRIPASTVEEETEPPRLLLFAPTLPGCQNVGGLEG